MIEVRVRIYVEGRDDYEETAEGQRWLTRRIENMLTERPVDVQSRISKIEVDGMECVDFNG